MNEQDEKILELYLKDLRKKKIFLFIFIIILIVSFSFYGFYTKYKQSSNDIDNSIQEESKTNIINENITKEETVSNIENNKVESNIENQNGIDEQQEEIKSDTNEEKKNETIEKNEIQVTTSSSNNNEKNTKEKPKNKDFLFTDGYTMDNVTQIAQDYLKSYDFSGECVPIKDNEGVYLGMRVIFY